MKVLSQALDDWRIVQVRREGNKVANEIILLSRRNIYSIVWLDSASICIMSLISDDCNSYLANKVPALPPKNTRKMMFWFQLNQHNWIFICCWGDMCNVFGNMKFTFLHPLHELHMWVQLHADPHISRGSLCNTYRGGSSKFS